MQNFERPNLDEFVEKLQNFEHSKDKSANIEMQHSRKNARFCPQGQKTPTRTLQIPISGRKVAGLRPVWINQQQHRNSSHILEKMQGSVPGTENPTPHT